MEANAHDFFMTDLQSFIKRASNNLDFLQPQNLKHDVIITQSRFHSAWSVHCLRPTGHSSAASLSPELPCRCKDLLWKSESLADLGPNLVCLHAQKTQLLGLLMVTRGQCACLGAWFIDWKVVASDERCLSGIRLGCTLNVSAYANGIMMHDKAMA